MPNAVGTRIHLEANSDLRERSELGIASDSFGKFRDRPRGSAPDDIAWR